MAELSLADRATIANMAPEYGATMGFFPVDKVTLDYLRLTGRDEKKVSTSSSQNSSYRKLLLCRASFIVFCTSLHVFSTAIILFLDVLVHFHLGVGSFVITLLFSSFQSSAALVASLSRLMHLK